MIKLMHQLAMIKLLAPEYNDILPSISDPFIETLDKNDKYIFDGNNNNNMFNKIKCGTITVLKGSPKNNNNNTFNGLKDGSFMALRIPRNNEPIKTPSGTYFPLIKLKIIY